MATISFYLDVRRAKRDGRYPLKLVIRHARQELVLPMGIDLQGCEWSKESQSVMKHPQRGVLNALLHSKRGAVEQYFNEIVLQNGVGDLKRHKEMVDRVLHGDDLSLPDDECRLVDALVEYVGRRALKDKTRETFDQTIIKVRAFDGTVSVNDVDRFWLERFDSSMAESGLSVNTRGIYMRNIRTVFNYLIDEERVSRYPFRKFKIKVQETAKRSLSLEELRQLIRLSLDGSAARYRDLFVLSFLLRGINPKDLLLAKQEQVIRGRLEYDRSKTGRHYSVLVEPEAWEIIDRYRGEEYLLDVMEYRSNYDHFVKQWTRGLKGLGGEWSGLSTYWARHSWATIAHGLGVSKDVISLGLGHSFGVRVTDVYINYDMELVDDANRLIIDALYRD